MFPHFTTSLSIVEEGPMPDIQRKGEQEWQRQRANQGMRKISMAMVPRLSPGRRYASAWNKDLPRFRDQGDQIGIPAGWQRYVLTGNHMSCRWESTGWMVSCTSVREQIPARQRTWHTTL